MSVGQCEVSSLDLRDVVRQAGAPHYVGQSPVVGEVDQPGRGGGLQVPLDVQLAQPLGVHQVAADHLH